MNPTIYYRKHGLEHCIEYCHTHEDSEPLARVVRYWQSRLATGYDIINREFVRDSEVLRGLEWIADDRQREHVYPPDKLAHDKNNIYLKSDDVFRWLDGKWVPILYTLGVGVTSIYNQPIERRIFDSVQRWKYTD